MDDMLFVWLTMSTHVLLPLPSHLFCLPNCLRHLSHQIQFVSYTSCKNKAVHHKLINGWKSEAYSICHPCWQSKILYVWEMTCSWQKFHSTFESTKPSLLKWPVVDFNIILSLQCHLGHSFPIVHILFITSSNSVISTWYMQQVFFSFNLFT